MSLRMMSLMMVLAFPLLADAQGRPGRPPSSLELLLRHSDELALTAEQVAGVEALQAALEQKNAPLHEQLKTLRPPRPPEGTGRQGGPPPDSAEMRAKMQQAEPLFSELRANDEAAYAQAEKLLSTAQQAQARELIQQAREQHHRRRGGMPPPPGQQ